MTEIHLTLREHSNALEHMASAQHGLEDAMAGLRLSCAQEFSALEGLQGLEKRMQTVERSFGEAATVQKGQKKWVNDLQLQLSVFKGSIGIAMGNDGIVWKRLHLETAIRV